MAVPSWRMGVFVAYLAISGSCWTAVARVFQTTAFVQPATRTTVARMGVLQRHGTACSSPVVTRPTLCRDGCFSRSDSVWKLQSSSSSSAEGELVIPFKKVFVAGGTRGVGRIIVEKLAGSGVPVVAIARTEAASKELESINTLVHSPLVDAFDYKAVETALDGCDAAISTLGQGSLEADSDKFVDYEGNSNVIEAAGVLGVTRVILVTSVGCGNSKEAAPPAVFELLEKRLAAKERAENLLIKYYTNTNWTIIRPGGLKSEPATGAAILTLDSAKAIGSIHREDAAILVLKALGSEKTTRQIFTAVDPSISTSVTYTEEGSVEEFVF